MKYKIGQKVLLNYMYDKGIFGEIIEYPFIPGGDKGFYTIKILSGINKDMECFRHENEVLPIHKNCSKIRIKFLRLLINLSNE